MEHRSNDFDARSAYSRAFPGPSPPDAMVSRASFKRNGPRSGLSSEDSSRRRGDFSGDFFLPELRSGEGLAREVDGEGEGGRRVRGDDAVLGFDGSDLSVVDRIGAGDGSDGTVIRSEGASGGVLTETRPGMVFCLLEGKSNVYR